MKSADQIPDYWNHNSAYHPLIVRAAAGKRVLDVGCGEGLLLQKLAPVCHSATGIDPDQGALEVARSRLVGTETRLVAGDFETYQSADTFDLITFVATLHHTDLDSTLAKAADLLTPGGELIVIGLSSNKTMWHWLVSGIALPLIRIMGRIHHESNPKVVVADARESLEDIRSTAERLLPGVRIRRALYYRYVLRWTKP